MLIVLIGFVAGSAFGQGHEVPNLRPPHGELLPTFWELHGWQVVLGGAVVLGVVALAVGWWRRPRLVVPEPPEVVARRALEGWRGRAEDDRLVAEVSRALKCYVVAAFQLPAEELTTTEFRRRLQARADIKPAVAAVTADFLRRCDQWKFAPAHSTPRLGAVAGALELVDKLEAERAQAAVKGEGE